MYQEVNLIETLSDKLRYFTSRYTLKPNAHGKQNCFSKSETSWYDQDESMHATNRNDMIAK